MSDTLADGPCTSQGLTYVITVSRRHFLAAQMCILTLRQKTSAPILVVGNLDVKEATLMRALGVEYVDERDIDVSGRMPIFAWTEKHREAGWYRQMFLRLSVDRYVDTAQAVILDSEVFVFDNWDESRLYDTLTGRPRCLYWIPAIRKPEWDYRMYRGAAYLLRPLPGFEDVFRYANSNTFHRHISGVVLFSTANVRELWRRLENETELARNLDLLFNHEQGLSFSDHDFYGIAADYGLFDEVVPTAMHDNLLGWYDNHDDPHFNVFRKGAMWSMCQRYSEFPTPEAYRQFMESTAASLDTRLPTPPYWNQSDRELIIEPSIPPQGIDYFDKYTLQLDYTNRVRSTTMGTALRLLSGETNAKKTIVEIGTLRDNTTGGGHSTYKFGEYCSKYGGVLHTVDISELAIAYSMKATSAFQPWIRYHLDDSKDFLTNFSHKIDLLYLDGLDALPGQEDSASRQQLAEIVAALPHLSDECLVLLDDADLPGRGKTRYSAPFLARHGFALHVDAYQQLFVRGFGVSPKPTARGRLRRALPSWGARQAARLRSMSPIRTPRARS